MRGIDLLLKLKGEVVVISNLAVMEIWRWRRRCWLLVFFGLFLTLFHFYVIGWLTLDLLVLPVLSVLVLLQLL